MPSITVILEGDGAFEDWKERETFHLGNNAPAIRIAALPHGMSSGLPAVCIGIDLDDADEHERNRKLADSIRAIPLEYLPADERMQIIRSLEARRVVMAETSMRLFFATARAFRARYGDVDLQD